MPTISSAVVAGPAEKRLVHTRDAAVRLQREVAARRVLEHVLEIVDPGVVHGSAQTNVRIAAMTSSGALRLGQWPVASKMIIWLSGCAVDEFADLLGRDDVLAALKDQRRDIDFGQVRRDCRT